MIPIAYHPASAKSDLCYEVKEFFSPSMALSGVYPLHSIRYLASQRKFIHVSNLNAFLHDISNIFENCY